MAIRLTIGEIDFTARAVPLQSAEMALKDPTVARAIWREVWRWDGEAQSGTPLERITRGGAVPLPNGLVFHVARTSAEGAVGRDDAASKRMAERVVAATGAPDLQGLNKAFAQLVKMPQKTLPLEQFSPLNEVASYKLRMHTSFDVVLLREKEKDLALHVCMPGRVTFHHEITAIHDEAGLARVLEERPGLRNLQVTAAVPARSAANAGLRRLALGQSLKDLRQRRQTLPKDTGGAVAAENLDRRIAATEAELRTVTAAQTPG